MTRRSEMDAVAIPPPEQLDSLDDAAFRAVVRRFLEANYPPAPRYPPRRRHRAENVLELPG